MRVVATHSSQRRQEASRERPIFDTDRLQSNIVANAKNRGISVDQAKAERMATVPARRFGTPDEFGAACAFLCSAQAGYITGQNLLIDGGAFPGAM